jgi:hypothetical protein
VRILFWNVGRAELGALVAEAAHQEGADLVCLAESQEPVASLSVALNTGQRQPYLVPRRGVPADLRRGLRLFVRLPTDSVEPLHDDHGIVVRRVSPPIGFDYTFIGLHMRSKLFQDPADQPFAAVRLRKLIDDMEARAGHRRTVIVGDFNMDPFEQGVVAADGLHAVMTRKIALGTHRTVDGEQRYFFYNPMWSHFGDRLPSPPGTYFHGASGQTSYFWHMFDQILVRPELLPFFDDESVKIITQIGRRSLLNKDGVPDKATASDHLPLVFDLSVEKGQNDGRAEPLGEAQAAGI